MTKSTISTVVLIALGAGAAYLFLRKKPSEAAAAEESAGGDGGGGGGFSPEGYIEPTAVLGAERSDTITIQQQQQQAPSVGQESLQYWQSQTPPNLGNVSQIGTSKTSGTGGATAQRGGTGAGGGAARMPVRKAAMAQPAKRFSGFLNMDAEVVDMEENM